jgi:hypothetical protein
LQRDTEKLDRVIIVAAVERYRANEGWVIEEGGEGGSGVNAGLEDIATVFKNGP